MTKAWPPPDAAIVHGDVERALAEDIGSGDISAALIGARVEVRAMLVAKSAGVLAGRAWFDAAFRELDSAIEVTWSVDEGAAFTASTRLAVIAGNARAVLSGERTALNFLQTLSATATRTRAFATLLDGSATRLLDTRKTLPGLRYAQKYAVRVGGGVNHRMGLYDAFLIKENHIAAAGGIAAACHAARALDPAKLLEVEVESLDEFDAALAAGCDRIMLDEFSAADIAEAVRRADGRVALEVSGSVDADRLTALAATGVDFVSVGALTKHIDAIDLSLRIESMDER